MEAPVLRVDWAEAYEHGRTMSNGRMIMKRNLAIFLGVPGVVWAKVLVRLVFLHNDCLITVSLGGLLREECDGSFSC
jgi:hypothetical protein